MAAIAINSGTVYAESRARVAGRVDDLEAHLEALEARMDAATSKDEFISLLTSYRLSVRDGLAAIRVATVETRD